ncbi:MAG: hypothetical protein U0X93_02835 [Anaerolineales bacterium]
MIIKDKDGKVVFEIPLTFGVVGTLIARNCRHRRDCRVVEEATVVVEKRNNFHARLETIAMRVL